MKITESGVAHLFVDRGMQRKFSLNGEQASASVSYMDSIKNSLIWLALIENGAQVLHDRSVELARNHSIVVEVLSAFTGAPGTLVGLKG